MFKKIAVGTAFLAAALAIVPTAAQAQDRYYGNNYGGAYSGYNYAPERYDRDRHEDHEARERRERFERQRAFREHLRWEREHRLRFRGGYSDHDRDDYRRY